MKEKKAKSITSFNFSGKKDFAKAGEIYTTNQGIDKLEVFDTSGNLVRENKFDKTMKEDNIVEYTYDSHNKLVEKITYKNYYNQPHTRDYLYKYVYKHDLLTEILHYFRTFDSSGFFAKNVITYNGANQKIKDEFTKVDEGLVTTIMFNWKDRLSYTESIMDKAGVIAERHFVVLNDQGKETTHSMNFELSSQEDTSFPVSNEYTFDQYGNELTRVESVAGKPVKKTVFEYKYEGRYWNYRVFKVNGNIMWTQFRKITYY